MKPTDETSRYWLDQVVEKIITTFPNGEIVLSSGISPSASYHIGHFREILTVDVITGALNQAGRTARHIHVVDNFDPLRRRYEFLPESYEQYVGHPVCLIPDPAGDCHDSYAAHFYDEFALYTKTIGIEAEIVFSYEDLYKPGNMNGQIETVLSNADKIRVLFEEISNRKLELDWTPVQVIDEAGVMRNGSVASWDKAAQTIAGQPYTNGRAKLNWRLDWPARWQVLGVMVEPHGQEHATKGGSYETGAAFARQVFGFEPPLAIAQYAFIHLPGENTKMSSSKGNLLTPAQVLEIIPPELLRYFIVKSKPEKTLYFDTGKGVYSLWQEYKDIAKALEAGEGHVFKRAYETANAHAKARVTSDIPFDHLVSAYQSALGDERKIYATLERSGYREQIKTQSELIAREINYVKNWLNVYAPDEVKFELQKTMPKVELSESQKQFLQSLARRIEKSESLDGPAIHEIIYELKDQFNLEPAQAFGALYKILLNQTRGPKLGWFLASLDKEWLIKRLNQLS